MKRTTITRAVLIEIAIIGAVIWSAFNLPGCATLHSAEDVARALCKLNRTNMQGGELAACDTLAAVDDWTAVVNLAAAKPDVAAVKESLAAHPPLSSAAALAMPCLAPPHIDEINSYREPQSRIERRLYPFVVEPPARGE